MTKTDTINSNDELTLDQLNDVSGGIPPALALGALGGTAIGLTAGGIFYYATTKAAKTMNEGTGVVPREDGTDGTGFNPNSPITSAPFEY